MGKVSPEKEARSQPKPNGAPTDKRGCRDILFLLIFLIVWAGMGFVAYYAFAFGDLDKI